MSTAIVPFNAAAVELASDPGSYVVLACERAKEWLTQAIECGEIETIVELKSQAEAIRVYSLQKQLGKDAECAAAEIVRRSERGLGMAVKRGQEEGTIRPPSRSTSPRQLDELSPLPRPVDFFGGEQERTDAYALADAPDEDFEEAIAEAKAEGNLSRKNVKQKAVRKTIVNASNTKRGRDDAILEMARGGHRTTQIADTLGFTREHVSRVCAAHGVRTADAVLGKARRPDSNRIVAETVAVLDGAAMGVGLVTVADLDPERADAWATSLSNSLRSLNRLAKQLKEMTRG